MSPTVVVIGDALLDVRVAPAEPVRRGSDVPARIDQLPGGQGANVAVRLARLGVTVSLVTALGRDLAAAQIRAALQSEGIDLRVVPVVSTGTVVVLTEPDGERTMLSQRPAFAHLVDLDLVPAAPWLVVSGYLLHEPVASELAGALVARGDRRALLGCAVPDRAVRDWRRAAAALDPDLVLANRDEAVRLSPPGARGVAVTDASGATLTIAGVSVSSITPAGAVARDTTGAGDAVAAGLLAGLQRAPWPPPRQTMLDAIEAAVALGSRVAGVAGAQARVAGERSAGLPA